MITAGEILDDLVARHPRLGPCVGAIGAAVELLVGCFRGGGKLLICGNGGSAADGDHISAELLKGFRSKRLLQSGILFEKLPAVCGHLQGALPAIPLGNFTALLTAFANDCSHEYAFAQLVHGLGRGGDVLLSISTSGNSANVLRANEVAKAIDMKVIGLGGIDGGKMAPQCDVCIRVPERETYLIQELHLPIYHAICSMVEAIIF